MKKNLLLMMALFVGVVTNAQVQTLVGDNFSSGGYGGPVIKTGFFGRNQAILSGGRGAWVINHRLAIGGGGYSMFTDLATGQNSDGDKPLFIDMNYGGFELEYIFNHESLAHFTVHTMFGGGTIRLIEHNPNVTIDTDKIYMIEPSINMDVNVNSWIRIGFGVSYRYSMGLDILQVSSSALNGFSGLISFKFGSF
jgi:hypothetical protein